MVVDRAAPRRRPTSGIFYCWFAILVCTYVTPIQATPRFEENFEDGEAPTWKYYDNSLDFRDAPISESFAGRQSKLITGEGNAAWQQFTMMLFPLSLSFPTSENAVLQFSVYLQADGEADDELRVDFEGHSSDSQRVTTSVPVTPQPRLNQWQTVMAPFRSLGDGSRLDDRFSIVWSRGAHDRHILAVDDAKILVCDTTPPSPQRSVVDSPQSVDAPSMPHRWWQKEKVRIMLAKPQVMPRPEYFLEGTKGYQAIAAAGFNVMIPYVGVRDHERCGRYAAQFGLKMIARTPVPGRNWKDRVGPRFVWQTGYETGLPCPYGAPFWDARMLPHALIIAKASLRVPLVGMEYDFEIYDERKNKYAHIYTHCYCDTCWQAFRVSEFGSVPLLPKEKRHHWLLLERRLGTYKVLQDERLRAQAIRFREAVHAVNPELHFMLLPWGSGHFLEVLAKAWGSPETPVLLAGESTYGRGASQSTEQTLKNHTQYCQRTRAEMIRIGIYGLVIPGVMPGYRKADPVFCRENATLLSRHADGYWVFFQQLEPDTTVNQYMDEFQRANATIRVMR